MKKLANAMALAGLVVCLTAVTSAFIIKSYWLQHINWDMVADKTNLAFVLSGLLAAVALWARALAKSEPEKVRRQSVLLVSLCVVIVAVSTVFVSGTVWRMAKLLQYVQTQTYGQEKYKFSADWTTTHTDQWVKHLQHLKGRPVRAMEIGSFEGRSALWFLENVLTHSDSSITCIDIFMGDYEQTFDSNIAASGLERKVKKLKGDSKIVLRSLSGAIHDFLYVDGSHYAKDVLSDTVLAWDLLKPGGLMIFDDYQWTGVTGQKFGPAHLPGIAIDAFLHVYEPYLDVLLKDYQVIVRKKEKVDLDSQKFGILDHAWKLLW